MSKKTVKFNIGLRECQIPRAGCSYLWADFEAAEMHTLAQACKDEIGYSRLGELLNATPAIDPHAHFGGIGLHNGINAADVMRLPKAEIKRTRGWAKPYNFGKPGGMGSEKFIIFSRKQYDQKFTREEADRFGRIWFEEFPEVKELHAVVKRKLGRNETCTIRLHRGGLVLGGKRFTAACNAYFQAPCAAGAKRAWNHVMRECCAVVSSPLYGFRVWNFVHDELCLEGPTDRIHEAGIRLEEIMVECFNLYTPDYPTGVEVMAGNAWSKEGERCLDANGKLTPWIYEQSEGYQKMLQAERLLLAA